MAFDMGGMIPEKSSGFDMGGSSSPALPASNPGVLTKPQLQQLVVQEAEANGVPPEIALKMINTESDDWWNPKALSRKGAQGLGQLMPGTAKDMGVTDPYDPVQNIRGSMKYMGQQLKEFKEVPLALAAYNAGPQTVRDKGGIPDYPETQAYVRRIAPTQMQKVGDAVTGAVNEVTNPLPNNKILSKKYWTENVPRSLARFVPSAAMGAGRMAYNAAKTFTDPVVSAVSGGNLQTAATDLFNAPSTATKNILTQLGEGMAAPLGLMGKEAASEAWNDPAASVANIAPVKYAVGQTIKPALSRRSSAIANRLMDMTLNQPASLGMEQIADNIKTVFDNKIPVSLKGVDKLDSAITGEIGKINDGMQAGELQGITGNLDNTKALIEGLRDEANRSDLYRKNNALLDSQISRLDNHPSVDIMSGEIPIQELQRMKIEQMQNIQKDYGAHTPQFQKEVDKARIRGFKEELENKLEPVFPELAESNAQLGRYYELQKVLERAVQNRHKQSAVGVGMLMKPGVGAGLGSMFGHTGAGIGGALGTALSLIEHPATAPKIAHYLHDKSLPNLPAEQANLLRAQILAGLGTTATNNDQP